MANIAFWLFCVCNCFNGVNVLHPNVINGLAYGNQNAHTFKKMVDVAQTMGGQIFFPPCTSSAFITMGFFTKKQVVSKQFWIVV